ncbi:hypothetical protein BDV95DRAFT_572185 [Massariosphaeria phaeospora]|uniref:Uncharacterized protein n=1 Tax=Massariosphaeria phaeospora TaxID=100035 RepID=A0A7C8IF55_9PLEO|nr:hypothetical protein BDV95DRAFT_572185 [Massariosphaeria phaeospora]
MNAHVRSTSVSVSVSDALPYPTYRWKPPHLLSRALIFLSLALLPPPAMLAPSELTMLLVRLIGRCRSTLEFLDRVCPCADAVLRCARCGDVKRPCVCFPPVLSTLMRGLRVDADVGEMWFVMDVGLWGVLPESGDRDAPRSRSMVSGFVCMMPKSWCRIAWPSRTFVLRWLVSLVGSWGFCLVVQMDPMKLLGCEVLLSARSGLPTACLSALPLMLLLWW